MTESEAVRSRVPGHLALEPFAHRAGVPLLKELAAGESIDQERLARRLGIASATVARNLEPFRAIGAVEAPRPWGPSARPMILRITKSGIGLLPVAYQVERFTEMVTAGRPAGTVEQLIRVVGRAWDMTLLARLTAQPRTIAEIAGEIQRESNRLTSASKSSLYRTAEKLRMLGLVRSSKEGREVYFQMTPVGRAAVGPLIWAHRWERKHIPHMLAPTEPLFAGAAFNLALGRTRAPARSQGNFGIVCYENDRLLARIFIEVNERGIALAAHRGRLRGLIAAPSPEGWIEATTVGNRSRLVVRGDHTAAKRVVQAIAIAVSGERKRA